MLCATAPNGRIAAVSSMEQKNKDPCIRVPETNLEFSSLCVCASIGSIVAEYVQALSKQKETPRFAKKLSDAFEEETKQEEK